MNQRATATIDTVTTCARPGCGATHKAQRVLDLGPWEQAIPLLVAPETPPGWHAFDGLMLCSLGCVSLVVAELERTP